MIRLTDPLSIGTMRVPNRLYRAPVLEGAGSAPDPSAVYAKHFVPNARAGVGLVIQGNTIVTPEGRTSPGMSSVHGPETLHALASMVDAVHAAGARIVIQLGHGGLFALESWHAPSIAVASSPPLVPSPPPWWLRLAHGRWRVPDTDEVAAMAVRFGLVARWAREAGYDGVQLAGANAKLLHQFLSRTWNKRGDRYGGSLAARTRLLREIRQAIAQAAGADFPVLLKYTAHEVGTLCGITPDEGVAIARIAEEAGFDALTPAACAALPDTSLCRGGYPGRSFENKRLGSLLRDSHASVTGYALVRAGFRLAAWQYPFAPVWNTAVFSAVKEAVSIPVFAVGGIRTPAQAGRILEGGQADMIGIGRPFYAEPDLAARFLAWGDPPPLRCESCNRCVLPQMLGLPGVCYNPASQKRRPQRTKSTAA